MTIKSGKLTTPPNTLPWQDCGGARDYQLRTYDDFPAEAVARLRAACGHPARPARPARKAPTVIRVAAGRPRAKIPADIITPEQRQRLAALAPFHGLGEEDARWIYAEMYIGLSLSGSQICDLVELDDYRRSGLVYWFKKYGLRMRSLKEDVNRAWNQIGQPWTWEEK